MPKNNKIVKEDGRTRKVKTPRKLRIGSRKSGMSAHSLSTEQLLKSFQDNNMIKHRAKISKVLQSRDFEGI